MKKLLVILALLLPFSVNAQKKGFKLIERSPKATPSWVGAGSMKGFILTQTEDSSLAEAKTKCIDAVRAEMASSVATQIQREISIESTIIKSDGNSTHGSESHVVTTSRIAKMPAIQGVSIVKAEIYYELYRNKKTKEEYYKVYAKYPFSLLDLDNLVEAYNLKEAEINGTIDKYRAKLDSIESTDDIANAVNDLKILSKSLDSSDERISEIDAIINNYNGIYKNIMIDVVEKESKTITFNIKYKGRVIKTSQIPDFNSNCAAQYDVKIEGDNFVLRYVDDFCYKNDENYVSIKFRFGNKYVTKQVYF